MCQKSIRVYPHESSLGIFWTTKKNQASGHIWTCSIHQSRYHLECINMLQVCV